jgi:hypothetical protein
MIRESESEAFKWLSPETQARILEFEEGCRQRELERIAAWEAERQRSRNEAQSMLENARQRQAEQAQLLMINSDLRRRRRK